MSARRWLLTGALGFSAVPAAIQYRRWHLRWGATDEEVAESLPGDDMCERPNFAFTRAITIKARPEDVWPWLVQIGFGKAGWYSYDWLDNRGRHSAEEIIPELQYLEVGGWVAMDFSGREPTETTANRVKAFETNKWLLWEHQGDPWVWVLRPVDENTTRLITRGRQRYHWGSLMLMSELILMEIGDPFMMRKLLFNVKRRAECLAENRNQSHQMSCVSRKLQEQSSQQIEVVS